MLPILNEKRVVIIDMNHIIYKALYSNFRLTHQEYSRTEFDDMGRPKLLYEIETTLLYNFIQFLNKVTNKGTYPCVVVGDRPVYSRKRYFKVVDQYLDMKYKGKSIVSAASKGYKEGRDGGNSRFYEGAKLVQKVLENAGVCYFAKNDFEADDFMLPLVEVIKKEYPGYVIDIYCNDADLIPLVDESVSVYFYNRKLTFADDDSPEVKNYLQVSYANFERTVQHISAFKGYEIPYNTVLLFKLFRGDTSDSIAPLITPAKYKKLLQELKEDITVNLSEICRYGKHRYIYYNPNNPKERSLTYVDGYVRAVTDPKELVTLYNALKKYISDEEILERVLCRYRGMNLNSTFRGNDVSLLRDPIDINDLFVRPFNYYSLKEVCKSFSINI